MSGQLGPILESRTSSSIHLLAKAHWEDYAPTAHGIHDVNASATIPLSTDSGAPFAQLTILALSGRPRSASERQIVLALDDSVRVDLGTGKTVPSIVGVSHGVAEFVSVGVAWPQLGKLVRAATVSGSLGQTPFVLSNALLAQLRSFYTVGICAQ